MTNQVVMITGALTGIGRATAVAFAHQGATIIVSGRKVVAGNTLAVELRGLGAEADFVQADVRRDEDTRNLVEKVVTKYGRLDVAINNAGTEGHPGIVTDQTEDSYAATFDTNVLGVLLSMKHELRIMQKQRFGNVINISSAYGHVGSAYASVYVASKHAVEGLTKSAALEAAAFGVRVNAVAPGPIETEMLNRFTGNDENKAGMAAQTALKRLGRPEEIADVIVFVASEKASYITGQSIGVDGGILAR
jgi:NAD(P)-dependent dehydrogenase (short-subunit alcohol dehydrogenase family)